MKFIEILSLFFIFVYFFIAVDYFSFDKETKFENLKQIPDKSISMSFKSQDYRKFVYDK